MTQSNPSQELPFSAYSGWSILLGTLVYWVVNVAVGIQLLPSVVWLVISGILSLMVTFLFLFGYFIVNPNMSRVLVLFGTYRGTVRTPGFYWTNPFTSKRVVSLRAHNSSSERVKVNDLLGNPIEIGAVVVWRVRDSAQAQFDVEDYYQYVDLQCETAVRQLAKSHPYDDRMGETEAPSLRTDTERVSAELTRELQERLDRAGIEVLEARISHLAYAPEIASAMLQRQQADAIIAARRKIVEGAVGMVDDALTQLSERGVLDLDVERRATLVGNLLVVLCGHATPHPVINAGTLYN